MKKSVLAFSVALISSILAEPDARAQIRTTSVTVVLPSHFRVGNRTYDGNLDGLREYIDSTRKSDPDGYQILDARLSKLESHHKASTLIFLGGGILGTGLMLVPTLLSSRDDSPSVTPIIAGGFILGGSMLLGFGIRPGRKEFMGFINKHNEQNPSTPIEMQLGFIPGPGGGQGVLAARF